MIRRVYACMSQAMGALASAALALAVVSCSGNVERKWTEEVDIGNGTVVTINRHTSFKESHSISGDVYSVSDTVSILEFDGENARLPKWRTPLVPLVLYRDENGEWVIVASTDSCRVWDNLGRPIPMYWEYRSRGGDWRQAALSESSMGRKTNLFFNYHPPLQNVQISMAVKERVLRSNRFAKKYLSIDATHQTNCR